MSALLTLSWQSAHHSPPCDHQDNHKASESRQSDFLPRSIPEGGALLARQTIPPTGAHCGALFRLETSMSESDATTTLGTLETLGANIIPDLVGVLLTKYDPTCDIAGARTAAAGLVANAIALQKAIDTKTPTEAVANV